MGSRRPRATGTILSPSTSSTRTPRLRKRVSSTRRKVSTTWSRRRLNSRLRSQPLPLSAAVTFKRVGRFVLSYVCLHVFREARRAGRLPRDSVMYVIVHKFLQFPVRRVVEAVGKAVSRQHSMLAGLLQSCSRCRRWLVVFSSYFFRNTPRYTLISRVEQ